MELCNLAACARCPATHLVLATITGLPKSACPCCGYLVTAANDTGPIALGKLRCTDLTAIMAAGL